jgi:hypothetical protein
MIMKIRREPKNSTIRQTESSEIFEKPAVIDFIKSFTEIKKK